MVPKGWNILSLRDLVDFTNGKAHENDVDECGQFVLVNSKFISTGGTVFKKTDSAHCPASEGDILMVMSDVPNGKAIAKCFYVTKNNEYTVNQRIARLRAIACDSHFLYYSLDRNKYYLKFDDGVKQTNLRKDEVLDCPIKVPPLPEQNKIAKILSTWDQAISTTEQLLANSQQQKKALMQQLLTGKKRLLDKNGVRFSGEWSRSGLGNVFDKISNGVTYDAKNMDGLPVTRIETISTGKINYEKVGWAPDEDNTRRFKLKKGDILYSHINSLEHIGRVAYFNGSKELYHGMNLLLLRAKKNYDSLFLFYVLNSQIGKKYAKTFAKSAVNQASISTADIKSFKVHIPCFDEQQKIGLVLSVADQDIETLQRKLDCLKQEKKALMQQLLTGKRRTSQ